MNLYGAPTTYTKIVPERGCGFILKRIYELTEAPGRERFAWPRKKDVYLGTRWYNRPGFASVLWSSLVKDGLIESDGGMQEYKCYSFFRRSHVGTRAAGLRGCGVKYTVRYHLTPKGRGVLFDMMERYDAEKDLKELEKLADSPPPEILQKEALEGAKLAANYAAENKKLRTDHAERINELTKRIVHLSETMQWIEDSIADTKTQLEDLMEFIAKTGK